MPELDTDTARIVSRLVDLQAIIAEKTAEAEALKAELRSLPPGEHDIAGKPVLRIIPNRRFDPAKALELVPESLRDQCYSNTLDSAKVKQYLAPALLDACMVEVGKPKVVLA